MVSRIKLDPRHVWAFASTLSGALSTLAFLSFYWQRSDGPEFIHLYSTSMLSIGWVNTFCFLGGFPFLGGSRQEGFLAYAIVLVMPIALRLLAFGEFTQLPEFLFLCGLAVPSLFAPVFRERLSRGEFRKVYKMNISFSLLLFVAAAAGLLLKSAAVIFYGSFLLAPAGWAAMLLFDGEKSGEGVSSLPAILNPTLLLLERSLFDQSFLIGAGVAGFTTAYYFISRTITFLGSVSFAVGVERAFSGSRAEAGFRNAFWALGVIFLLASAVPMLAEARFVTLAGQAALWLVVSWLVTFSRHHPTRYLLLLAILLPEIFLRWWLRYFVEDPAPWVLRALAANLLLIGCFQLRNPHSAKA